MINVLIVNPTKLTNREFYSNIDFASLGLDVLMEVCNARKAFLLIEKLEIDLLITDFSDMEFNTNSIRTLKSNCPKLVHIVVSSDSIRSNMNKLKNIDLIDYITTPFDKEEFINALVRAISKINENKASENVFNICNGVYVKDEKFVKNILLFMEKSYNQNITVSMVASKYFVSVGYLCKLLKKHTDLCFSHNLNRIRIKKAKELLLGTSTKVFLIAKNVGFKDISYFNSTFKKLCGHSPLAYRKIEAC